VHASLLLNWDGRNILVDPSGKAELYKGISAPDFILITDIHGDHYDKKLLRTLNTSNTVFIVPPAVADSLAIILPKAKVTVLKNGQSTQQPGFTVAAIPMYNLPETPDSRHPKGRGNGYILAIGSKRIYISGDTEDTEEMRSLKKIDIAFVCMNLPFTMDVIQAASAVLDFKPKIVYPYHHRGQDISIFQSLVNSKNKKIEVRLRNWYPE
jgi:L-ascorbate metabolism protein UlaG (beta-lactamase superfamily)